MSSVVDPLIPAFMDQSGPSWYPRMCFSTFFLLRRKFFWRISLSRCPVSLFLCYFAIAYHAEVSCMTPQRCSLLMHHFILAMLRWGVLVYKSVSDLNVTVVWPRNMNFRGRTNFTWTNFCFVHFECVKSFSISFLVFKKGTEKKTENKGNSFWCVQNKR